MDPGNVNNFTSGILQQDRIGRASTKLFLLFGFEFYFLEQA